MKNYLKAVLVLSCMVLPLFFFAQTEKELLAQLLQEEQSSVEALALYPEPTRLAILEAAKYPEALIKLESLQGKTSAAFKALLAPYPKELQEKVYDLTRYTGIVAAIVNGGQKWGIDFDVAMQSFPPEILQRARELSYDYFPLLTEVNRLNYEWDGAYSSLLSGYPTSTKSAIQQLVELPEVLSLLTDNIRLTVLVGDIYKKNPTWLLHEMDSLNIVVAEARTKEVDEWKQGLNDDPEARAELENAAKDYVGEYGYDDAYYNYDDAYYNGQADAQPTVEYSYYQYNYPYWFGYPYWQPYPRWRPYPYWYHWGFYHGPNNVIVFVDMPSYWFMNWYFYEPWHHYYYPHLSSHYTEHYYGHRGSNGSISSNVRNWKQRNQGVVTDEWLNKARTNPNTFKEYGKFETERERYNQANPTKTTTPETYLEKNRKRYPDLSQAVDRKKEQDLRDNPSRPPQEVSPNKPKDTKPTRRPDVSPKPPTTEPRKPDVTPRPRTVEPRKQSPIDLPKVEQAQKHHQDTWEQPKRETPQRTQPQPKVVQPPKLRTPAPAPKVDRKPSTPRRGG